MPQLINAHTHLEFSDCPRPIGRPGMRLADWIGKVYNARSVTTIQQKAQNILLGWRESQDAGVCLIGEIATLPCQYQGDDTLPSLVTFAEVLGLSEQRAAERLAVASDHLQQCSDAGISPHAPYSTPWALIQDCVTRAKSADVPLAMHVAESPEERELLQRGTGPFADALQRMGVWRDELFPWNADQNFVTLIDLLARAPSALLVHGNDLNASEIEKLAGHPNVTVVYCPRTHHFFGHSRHPVDRMLRAGVRVALGTDSRASNPDLSLWGEVQHLLKHRQDLSPHAIIQMATVGGADALRYPRWGRISAGSPAKFGCVATTAGDLEGLFRDFAEQPFVPCDAILDVDWPRYWPRL
ncbi:Aminodeoxyfutalosine deaminase [Stieleria varia]|uniref:Aminodeoxyfutalosine deaminase n=2 Tax=Stieleria varia TaxID=2528005 RepID=A0A5C5ZZ77_9BACT|nr:Aminodeoxyfutalosine deaminase [Stieleria varia]